MYLAIRRGRGEYEHSYLEIAEHGRSKTVDSNGPLVDIHIVPVIIIGPDRARDDVMDRLGG